MAPAASALSFSVRRSNPVLVTPAEPTPHELKRLSDIDLQRGQRTVVSGIWFYASNPAMRGKEPAAVVRDALSKALVYYYPFAGRLREAPDRRIVVECTGEGALFAEADANVRLEELEGELQPPFPCTEKFFCNAQEGAGGFLDSPLLLVQVTRLACGGFVMGVEHNHAVADAQGLVQLLQAMGELARGAPSPSLLPVWRRELLAARDPPRVTCVHREFEDSGEAPKELPDGWVLRSFFLHPARPAELKKQLPDDLRASATTFDVLAAYIWRCRTVALRLEPEEAVRALCFVTTRGRFPVLAPDGYYGNSFAHPAAVTTAGGLCGRPMEYAVRLVREAKSQVTEEYMRSAADLSAIRGWPYPVASPGTVMVSDLRHVRFRDVDFGWGKALYAGTSDTFTPVCIFTAHRDPCSGEEGIMVSIRLPPAAMERFAREMKA
ncbi:hypothetical protein Taro_031566 [Colocasia esculenta]|uniref:Uncharacterized protein n=1 Tax=Colocasia esculenta TaxID=4460 RepID=A0A843VWZ9_COLES|nr:hypothetical protein [Colocasia esculenta]